MAHADPDKARAYYAAYRERNREKLRAQNREYEARNRERVRERNLNRRYGISYVERDRMIMSQGGNCGLCHLPLGEMNGRDGDGAVVDHNHTTGKVRAIVHRSCNVRLAPVEDEQFRRLALTYLSTHMEKE